MVFVLFTDVFQTPNYCCNHLLGKCQVSWREKRDRRKGLKRKQIERLWRVIFTLLKRVKWSSRPSERNKKLSFSVTFLQPIIIVLPWWCKSCLPHGPGLPEQSHSGQSHAGVWLLSYLGENTRKNQNQTLYRDSRSAPHVNSQWEKPMLAHTHGLSSRSSYSTYRWLGFLNRDPESKSGKPTAISRKNKRDFIFGKGLKS